MVWIVMGITIAAAPAQAATRVAGTPIPNDTIIRNRADILSDTIPDLYLRNQMRDHLRVISAQTSFLLDRKSRQ